jgi:zinc protease
MSRLTTARSRTMRGPAIAFGAALALGGSLAPTALAAQAGPPPPLEARPLEFPAFERFSLENGIDVLVLDYGTQPVVSARLFFRGGSASEPAGRAGAVGLVSTVLTRGTETRTAVELSEAIEGVGGSLTAGADRDFFNVSTTVLTEHLPVAMELLADVVRNASFPADEVELARRQTLSSLQAQLGQPQAIASRIFNALVYGSHPYGVSATPASVEGVTREDLVDFHDRVVQPAGALLVVAGAVDRDVVERLAREHLGDWRGTPEPPPALPDPQPVGETRIHLVHRPGSVQSVILVGNLGVDGTFDDFPPLDVANRILGGGADSRLFRILREERGWTYGAYSGLTRPVSRGVFQAFAEVRTPVTDSATVELLDQVRRLGSEPVPSDELEAARNYLAGSFPLQIETAGQVAGRLASTLLMGRPVEDVTEFPARIRAASADQVRNAAAAHMRADEAVIVVVGDATEVLAGLEAIAPVTLLDVNGEVLEREAVMPAAGEAPAWDAARLEPGIRRYALRVQGSEVGTATYRLERDGDAWVGSTTVRSDVAGAQETEVRFSATDFAPIALRQTQSAGPMTIEVDLEVAEGRITGSLSLPAQLGGDRELDIEVGDILLPGMDEYALAASPLAEGVRLRIPYLDAVQGQRTVIEAHVVGREEIEVPAGTFDSWRVEIAGPQGTLTLFLRVEAPHILIEQRYPPGQPVSLVLTGSSPL